MANYDNMTAEQKQRLDELMAQPNGEWPAELTEHVRSQGSSFCGNALADAVASWVRQEIPSPPPPPVTFQVTTYWKRKRGEPSLTHVQSRRLALSQALDWVLNELPEDAVTVTGDAVHSVTVAINWDKVPAEIRYGTRYVTHRR